MKRSISTAVTLLCLVAAGWFVLGSWIDHFGPVVEGRVVAKEERVMFFPSDRWTHELTVSYRFQPPGARAAEEGRHRVDAALFDRLAPGTAVRVRYHPWSAVRVLAGYGSALADSTWWSRTLPLESSRAVDYLDGVVIALAGLSLWLAFRWRRLAIALVAGVLGSAVVYGILLLGALVWPAWLILWLRSRRVAYAFGLVASVMLGTVVLALRFPWPQTPADASRRAEATATVVQVHKADTLWTNGRRRGDALVQHFLLVDLEVVPNGAEQPVHAVDRVDDPGDRRYAKGAVVRVEYAGDEPRHARIAGAPRDFVAHSFAHFLFVWTLGGGIVVLLLAWAGIRIKQALLRRLPVSRSAWSDALQRREFIQRPTKGDRS